MTWPGDRPPPSDSVSSDPRLPDHGIRGRSIHDRDRRDFDMEAFIQTFLVDYGWMAMIALLLV